ncbi:MAG TPA: ATP-binding protein [Candidatus Omnitrophica bacterium]|nr:ATP-binding protein [Candidatus Omnitrophota bacterium]
MLSEEEKRNYIPRIAVEVKEKENLYQFIISDNGIGIREEDKSKMFTPFFTTKSTAEFSCIEKSGTGIGMYVVKRIIEENHHGRIWFDSDYLKGTTFYIEIPKKNI